MKMAEVLNEASRQRVALTIRGGRVEVTSESSMDDELLKEFRAYRAPMKVHLARLGGLTRGGEVVTTLGRGRVWEFYPKSFTLLVKRSGKIISEKFSVVDCLSVEEYQHAQDAHVAHGRVDCAPLNSRELLFHPFWINWDALAASDSLENRILMLQQADHWICRHYKSGGLPSLSAGSRRALAESESVLSQPYERVSRWEFLRALGDYVEGYTQHLVNSGFWNYRLC